VEQTQYIHITRLYILLHDINRTESSFRTGNYWWYGRRNS